MKPSEALRKGLAKLGPNGEHWIQRDWARDARGTAVWPTDSRACSFCSGGALKSVVGGNFDASLKFLQSAVDGSVAYFNDRTESTFPEIKAMFEKAIALAEAEESKVV